MSLTEVDDLINTTPCEECGADAGEQCRWHCTSQPEAALDEWHHLRVVVRQVTGRSLWAPGDLAPALATCTRCRRTTATVRLTAARKCADCITEARHG